MTSVIACMYAGVAMPFGNRGLPSAIAKKPIEGPWHIGKHGLCGDIQGDPVHHGGPEKALHHYPRDHYETWLRETPELQAALAAPPAFGENISTLGMTEETVCVGDVFRAGSVVLQVAQGRQPCWKLNTRFGRADMAMRVQSTGRTGWYYRVLETGAIKPGDVLTLAERSQPTWPLSRILRLLYHRTLDLEELRALANVQELADGWRRLAEQRVRSGRVEDWKNRLDGPR